MISKLTLVPTFLLLTLNTFGQGIDSIIAATDRYITNIDSNKTLAEGIEEGTVEFKSGEKGGYEINHLYDKTTKELYRIKYSESTDRIVYESYYYRDSLLIYVHIAKGKWKQNKFHEDFIQKIYYTNKKAIYNSSKDPNAYRPDIVYEEGIKYLKGHHAWWDKHEN